MDPIVVLTVLVKTIEVASSLIDHKNNQDKVLEALKQGKEIIQTLAGSFPHNENLQRQLKFYEVQISVLEQAEGDSGLLTTAIDFLNNSLKGIFNFFHEKPNLLLGASESLIDDYRNRMSKP